MEKKECIFDGVGVSEGIAIGIAHVRKTGIIDTPEYHLKRSDIYSEKKRLSHAVNLTKRQMRRLKSRVSSLPKPAAEELIILLDAYLHMLSDSRLVRGAEQRISKYQINAEAAVRLEMAIIAKAFQSMEDTYIAARLDDIHEVGNRLIKNLSKHQTRPFTSSPKGSIIIAESLSPADMAQINPKYIKGIATMLGGSDGHTAIMARALMIPSVLGASKIMDTVQSGDHIIVDGSTGRIILNPIQRTLTKYIRLRANFSSKQRKFMLICYYEIDYLLQCRK